MFSNAHDITIEGGTFTAVHHDHHDHYHSHINGADQRQLALDKLVRYIAPGAFHNSEERYDAPKCHPRTRESILKEIMEWIKDPNTERLFLWLYGPAGSGKSAIAQTIAELCQAAGILAASFFFSRTVPMRNEKTYLIPTLIYQLIFSIPETAEYIFNTINSDATIFSLSLATQVEYLIVRPLKAASLAIKGTRVPMLMLIDGMDECGGLNARSAILDALLHSIQRFNLPVYVLIASRPEQDIRDSFHTGNNMLRVSGLALDASYQPDADIKVFLRDKFDEIKYKHPSKRFIPAQWPSTTHLTLLVQKASGQFIYASTVIKFVDSTRHRPLDRLDIIIGLSPAGNNTPFAELDALYGGILESIDDDLIANALEIIAYVILHSTLDLLPEISDLSLQAVEAIFGHRPGDISIILGDLHALVFVPESEGLLRLHHASLSDYLFDQSRSGKFFIDYKKAHARIATCISRNLSKEPNNRLAPAHRVYSVLYHSRCSELSEELMDALYGLDLTSTVCNIDGQKDSVAPRIYSELAQELDHFMRWLDNEHDNDPFQVLLRYHAGTFFSCLVGIIIRSASVIQEDLCAMFATLATYREVRMLDIIEDVHGVHVPFSRDRLIFWMSSDSYMNILMSRFATEPEHAGVYLVNEMTYGKFASTLANFLVKNRNGEWSLSCDAALDTLSCVLPKAARVDVLEQALRGLLASLQFSRNDRFVMTGSRRGQWKSRLTKLAVKCLDFMKKHDIPHGEHIHRRDYDLCIWCEAKAEADRNVAPSGIPPGLRLKKKT
ncbi:hypothetical protein BJ912DRAFT_1148162 [Pholiota molesta]|nr:hypothetical protein BJ912DRAFT_1148162 [Pholiota molesta]